MAPVSNPYHRAWYEALDSEYGLVVEIPEGVNVESIKSYFNESRRKARDPRLFELEVHVYQDGKSLILRRKQNDVLE